MKKFLLCLLAFSSAGCSRLHPYSLENEYLRRAIGSKVVYIINETPIGEEGGTGFQLTYKGRTVIITNRHVCQMYDNSHIATIKFEDGRITTRKILSISADTDLCALEPIDELGSLHLASSVAIGESIAIVGHPALLPLHVSFGEIITELIEQVEDERVDAMLTSVVTLPGNSGSPAVDMYGHVVGVLFAGIGGIYWGSIIPLHDVQDFMLSL